MINTKVNFRNIFFVGLLLLCFFQFCNSKENISSLIIRPSQLHFKKDTSFLVLNGNKLFSLSPNKINSHLIVKRLGYLIENNSGQVLLTDKNYLRILESKNNLNQISKLDVYSEGSINFRKEDYNLLNRYKTIPSQRKPEEKIYASFIYQGKNLNGETIYILRYVYPYWEDDERITKEDSLQLGFKLGINKLTPIFFKMSASSYPESQNKFFDLDGDGKIDYIMPDFNKMGLGSQRKRIGYFLGFKESDKEPYVGAVFDLGKSEVLVLGIKKPSSEIEILRFNGSKLKLNTPKNAEESDLTKSEPESFKNYYVSIGERIKISSIYKFDADNDGDDEIVINTQDDGYYILEVKDDNFSIRKGDLTFPYPIQQIYSKYDLNGDGIDDVICKFQDKIGVGLGANHGTYGYHIYDFIASGEDGLTLKFGDYDHDRRDEIQLSWKPQEDSSLFYKKDEDTRKKLANIKLVFEKKENSDTYTYDELALAPLFNPKDWYGKSIDEVIEGRMTILAKHGFVFPEGQWRDFFKGKDWYKEDSTFSQSRLSDTEKRNYKFLLDLEVYKKNQKTKEGLNRKMPIN